MLGQRVPPYKTRLFNPLTGAMKRLRVQIPVEQLSAVVVSMSPSLRVFVSDIQNHTIRLADESSKEGPSYEFGEELCRAADVFGVLRSMTHFAGDLFVTDRHGILSTMKDAAEEGIQMVMKTTIASPGFEFPKNLFYLVESEGELLFVVSGPVYHGEPVYRVDTKNRLLEPVRSIGSHALFVSKNRCVSVDSSKAPTVQAGSIYFADLSEIRSYDYDALAWEKTPQVVMGYGVGWLDCCEDRPFLLDQVLAEYCRTIEYSELQMVPPYGEDGTTHYDYYDGCASE